MTHNWWIIISCWLIPYLSFGNDWLIRDYRHKGDLNFRKGEYELALDFYQKAYNLALKNSDFNEVAEICIDQSSVYLTKNNKDKLLSKCIDAKNFFLKAKSRKKTTEFKIYSSTAVAYRNQNDITKAIENYGLANNILNQHKDLSRQIPNYVSFHYSNQGVFKYSIGAFSEAESLFLKALAIQQKLETKSDLAIIKSNLASLFLQVNKFKEAQAILIDVSDYYLKQNNIYDFIAVEMLKNLAICQSKLGDNRSSLVTIKRAIELYRVITQKNIKPNLLVEAKLMNEMANFYLKDNKLDLAKDTYLKVLKNFKMQGINTNAALSETYIGLGRLSERINANQEAIKFYTEAIAATNDNKRGIYFEITAFIALKNRADALRKIGLKNQNLRILTQSVKDYEEAIRLALTLKKSYESPSAKYFFIEEVYPAFENALDILATLDTNRPQVENHKTVFRLMEQSKAIITKDLVDDKIKEFGNLPDSLVLKIHSYRQWITGLRNKVIVTNDVAEIDGLKKDISKYEAKFDSVWHTIELRYPVMKHYSNNFYSQNLVKFQSTIDKKSGYVNYIQTRNAFYGFAVTNEKTVFRKLSSQPLYINQLVKNLIDNSNVKPSNLDVFKGENNAKYLYGVFIKPFAEIFGSKSRLIINPDGLLHLLSFDILLNEKNEPLLYKYAISFSHSLPDFSKNQLLQSQDWLCFAPFHLKSNRDIVKENLMIDSSILGNENELKFFRGNKFVDSDANKRAFVDAHKGELGVPLLLLTHASADNNEPHILFRFGKDNKLRFDEISQMTINSPLVVLSACETAKGKLYRGEGQVSLAKAFAFAGCRSVLSTLWLANIKSTTYLTEQFYGYINEGYPKDIALQKAKIDYLESKYGKENDLPFYWAHFQIFGNVEPIFESQTSNIYRILILVMSVCVVVLILVYSKRLRK